MIDTVSYFNIIPYDITQFLLKFFYGFFMTDITFQNVLLCSDTYTSTFTLATKSIGK